MSDETSVPSEGMLPAEETVAPIDIESPPTGAEDMPAQGAATWEPPAPPDVPPPPEAVTPPVAVVPEPRYAPPPPPPPPGEYVSPPAQYAPPPAQYAPPPPPPYTPPYEEAALRPGPASDSSKILAGLGYIFGIVALVMLFVDPYKDEKFVKFHAVQAIAIWVAYIVIAFVLIIPILGWIAYAIAVLALFVFEVIALVKAFQGEYYEVPVVYSAVKSFLNE